MSAGLENKGQVDQENVSIVALFIIVIIIYDSALFNAYTERLVVLYSTSSLYMLLKTFVKVLGSIDIVIIFEYNFIDHYNSTLN